MSTQLRDGTFTETKELPEAMQEFMEALEDGNAKSFHVGSFDEVEDQKRIIQSKTSMDELSNRLCALEETGEFENGIIEIPNQEQIKNILKKTT